VNLLALNAKRLKSTIIKTFPLTLSVVVVLMFIFMASSPVTNSVFIKSASAYAITSNYDNIHLDALEFYGIARTGTPEENLFEFSSSGAEGDFDINEANIRTTGYVDRIDFSIDTIYLSYFDGLGYGATMNLTEFKTACRLVITITNPSSAVSTYYAFSNGTGYHVAYESLTGSQSVSGGYDGRCVLDTPYVFSVAGTYTIGYQLQTYY